MADDAVVFLYCSGQEAGNILESDQVMLPADKNRGFINDLDDGMPFWPDGQTDDCLYMLRTVTEMRELVKRTGSPKQKKLVELLDNPKVHERDYVMIVVR